jgi:hypothetical protein
MEGIMKKRHGTYYLAAALLACVAILVGLGCAGSSQISDSQSKSTLNVNSLANVANLMAIQIIDQNSATRRVFSALGEGLNGEYNTADCPNVTMDPPDIIPVPEVLTVNVDWGGGCEQSPGHVVSGNVVAVLTNIQFTDSIIAANYNVTANNVVDNGTQIANGNVTGYAQAVPVGGDSLHLNADMHFSNFLLAGYVSNGDATFSATNVNLSNMSLSNVTVTLTNFSMAGLVTAQNCVLSINQTGANTYNVLITGTTSLGALDLEAVVTNPSSNVYVFNTTRPGTISIFTVEMNDLTMDLNRCESNPTSGTLTISGLGNTYGKTFTGACDGDWNIPGL